MKIRYLKNILFIMLIFVITTLMFNSNVQAFKMNLSTSSQKINKGDTFSVTLKSDETFVTCDFQIKYDSDIFEYVDETQTNWSIKDYPSEGYLIAVYADISGKGTNNITIKFKAKKTTTNANISLQNENFTNTEGVSYNEETVTKNPVTIKVEENTTKPSEKDEESTTKPSEKDEESTTTSNDGKQNSSTQSSTPSTTITNTTSGQKTNGILPKTGKGTNIILVAIVILIIISILLKNKMKFWKGIGMFILAFTITTAVLSTSTYAYDVMPKYGKFDNLMSDKKIFAVCLDKNDKSGELKANQIPNLISDVLSLKDKNGKEISNDSIIGTGSKILLSDNTEYTLLLYGDVNGDGKINSGDIYPIIQHILKNTTLTDIYAKAANLSNKNDSNDAQINSTDIYPIIKFILRDLSTDLVVEFPTNGGNSGDIEEEKLSVNVSYSTTTTTTGTVTVKITANKELNSLNGWILSTDKKSLTKEYEQNVQESVTVTDINGETATVDIKISNIQKPVEDLVLSTTYSDTDWISGDVTATIKANKQIVAPNGWELSSDKKSITKEYSSNIEENVSVTDIDGITKTSKISINNIDKLKPSDFTPTATSTTKSITVTAVAEDADATGTSGKSGIAGYRFKLDSGEWTEYQTSGTYTWDNLTQTTSHTITVEAKDNAGNTKQGIVTKETGTIPDLAQGGITFSYSPVQGIWTNGSVTAIASTTITDYTLQTSKDGQTWSNETNQIFTSNGTIYARLCDGTNYGGSAAGNVTNIDTAIPTGTISTASDSKSITVSVTASDVAATTTNGCSGIKGYYYSINNGANYTDITSNNTYTFDGLTQGTTYYIKVKVEDNAGNILELSTTKDTLVSTYTITYDANGGEGAPDSQQGIAGQNTTISSVSPTKSCYTFKGWSTSSSGSVQYAPSSTINLEENVTLYAVYEFKQHQAWRFDQGWKVIYSEKITFGSDSHHTGSFYYDLWFYCTGCGAYITLAQACPSDGCCAYEWTGGYIVEEQLVSSTPSGLPSPSINSEYGYVEHPNSNRWYCWLDGAQRSDL